MEQVWLRVKKVRIGMELSQLNTDNFPVDHAVSVGPMCRYNPCGRVQPATFSRRVVSGESHFNLPRPSAPADQPLGGLAAAVAGNRTFHEGDGEPSVLDGRAHKITHFIGRLFRLY